MSRDLREIRHLRKQLGPLWNAFFGGFGRLTPVQAEAMPMLLAQRDAVICSPTASGKTEAVLAPAVRHLLDGGVDREGPVVLYIIPTRALVADMERRFGELLASLEVGASFRTSDTPTLPKRFPHILFTTPESFDSLLCRKPSVWPNVRTVILDELHLLDNTYRGDQLRVLLRRLETDHLTRRAHKVALSATIPDPEAMAVRYFGQAEVVSVGEPRGIDFDVVPTLAEAVARCREERRHKVLVFCNARKDCEELAAKAVNERLWPRDSIFVHHASLARTVRKETEAALREGKAALCFATMTLELGIDIGDIDAAVLYRPPPSVEAFQQRLGRACRRRRRIFGLGIAVMDEDAPTFRNYELLTRNALDRPGVYLPDLSVVVQQLLSLLFAHPRGLELVEAYGYVEPLCSPEEFTLIVRHLAQQEHLLVRGTRLQATESTMDLGEKGQVHSNISDDRSMEVFDSRTGRVLGKVSYRPDNPGRVMLGGKVWQVTGKRQGRILVNPTGNVPAPSEFKRHANFGKFYPYLPDPLQQLMQDRTLALE